MILRGGCSQWAAVVQELKTQAIPGLTLPRSATDDDLGRLRGLEGLRALDLWGCGEITDTGLSSLEELGGLRSLNLRFCKQVTDAGLAHLQGLKALRSLNLRECDQITDTGDRRFPHRRCIEFTDSEIAGDDLNGLIQVFFRFDFVFVEQH